MALRLSPWLSVLQPQEITHTTDALPHIVRPKYTKEAMDAKLEGTVVLSAVVDGDGIASDSSAGTAGRGF